MFIKNYLHVYPIKSVSYNSNILGWPILYIIHHTTNHYITSNRDIIGNTKKTHNQVSKNQNAGLNTN